MLLLLPGAAPSPVLWEEGRGMRCAALGGCLGGVGVLGTLPFPFSFFPFFSLFTFPFPFPSLFPLPFPFPFPFLLFPSPSLFPSSSAFPFLSPFPFPSLFPFPFPFPFLFPLSCPLSLSLVSFPFFPFPFLSLKVLCCPPGFLSLLSLIPSLPGLAVHQIITITVSLIMVIAALITTLVLKNW